MFTSLFLGYSYIVGGTLTISYAARAVMESIRAGTVGKTKESLVEVPSRPGVYANLENFTPPSLGLAAKTFLSELTVPLVAVGIGVEEMCRSAKDIGHDAWHGAGRILKRMDKRTSTPAVVDVVAAPSVPVAPSDHVHAAEPTTANFQPA